MTLDEAIREIQEKITAVSPEAVIRVARISDEEARLSVYAPPEDIQAIKDATFQPVLDLLNEHGLDVQVFPYDITTTPPPA
ncbi:MAG: hypothetical protein D6770_09470 [Anaerolineae bacterium]|nr:MAG: hypothetical protein D6770_09470 [Anaerolineae bacterium]